jgi:hypothetical protein
VEQRCPKCRLISPATATHCDCGWDFTSNSLTPAAAWAESRKYARYPLYSWLFPLIAWTSQLVFALSVAVLPDVAVALGFAITIAQFVLIVYGLYFGMKALTAARTTISSGQRTAAIVGVVLSSGTILLIVGAAVYRSV